MTLDTPDSKPTPGRDIEASPEEQLSFDALPLPDPVRAGIAGAGFTHCTPIQGKILPLSLAGRDVAGQAQTGTGKTAAFLITVFTRLLEERRPRRRAAPRALVIAPTRELVVQIFRDAEQLGSETGLTVQAVYGGVDYKKQREGLRQDVDVLVGTPGRLIDYWKQKVYDLRSVEVLVIDEADRMFDMGFIRDLRFLLRRCSPVEERQSMLFSATLSHDVMELAYLFMNDAVRIEVKPEQVTAEGVRHVLYHVGVHEKVSVLLGVLRREGAERTLVFVNMRRTADHLCRTLEANGYRAEQITGDIEQRKRMRILEEFRDGSLPILIATDVASRGLHIEGVTHVVNFDLPLDPEDYVHRVGRTARAGATGTAVSLACEDYVESLETIEKLIGFKIPFDFPDDDLMVPYRPTPRRPRRRDDHERERTAPREHGRRRSEPRAAPEEASAPPEAEAAAAAPESGEPTKRRRKRRRKRREAAPASPDAPAASAEPAPPTATADRPKRRRRRRSGGSSSGAEEPGAPAAARHVGSRD